MAEIDTKEYKKLETVNNLILKQINEMAQTLKSRREDLKTAHKDVWAETPIIRNMDDAINLVNISNEIAQHERQYAQASLRLVQLKSMLSSPYFARIDFKEEGFDEIEEIYIGKHSLFDGKQFHVYDWRAPISSLYYDYGVGKACFNVDDNIISGEITLKRQYHIVNGELKYLFDSELAIDDEILQMELSRSSDAKIKTIIHTIQREQNKAIRNDAARLLVFGPAGSGKTSVGLHRLAFLLYKHRGNLTSGKVRIFSPSPIFASYIEGIIPELGEEDVQTLDFPSLLPRDTCAGSERSEEPAGDSEGSGSTYNVYEHFDFLQNPSGDEKRRFWLAQKYSAAFVEFLESFVRQYSPSLEEDIRFNRDIVCTAERVKALYEDRTKAGTLSGKTARVIEFVTRSYEEYFKENTKEITTFFNNIYEDTLTDGVIRHRFEEQKNIVLADLRNRLIPPAKKLYERALRAWAKENKLPHIQDAVGSLKWERVLYEDALSLFYINLLTGRIPKDNQVKHILLDEAQDISYLQHKILQRFYGDNCHFTVLADVNQSLYPEIHLHSEEELLALYPSATVSKLTTSYRSTYEISRFAANVLGIGDAHAYKRHGDEPRIIDTKDPASSAVEIIESLRPDFNTIGILLSTTKAAEKFSAEFKQLYSGERPLKLSGFDTGIMIMAVPYAKGLEFDAVICPEYGSYNPDSSSGSPMDAKHLYLICTRALHQLYLLRRLAD